MRGNLWVMLSYFSLSLDGGHGPILFYNCDQPYYDFTNFVEYKIVLNWRHMLLYIWTLLSNPEVNQDAISKKIMWISLSLASLWVPTPATSICAWVRKDWHIVKDNVLYQALIAKFAQHKWLQECLLSTGDRKFVEHSPFQWQWHWNSIAASMYSYCDIVVYQKTIIITVKDNFNILNVILAS